MSYKQRIVSMIESDETRMRALRAVRTLDLPDWLIAAGFVRNMIWSNTFGRCAELNDIDVVYYCPRDISKERDHVLEGLLNIIEPDLPWFVKNQARMHIRNSDIPYKNTVDAMGYWPEKQTAIGVQLSDSDEIVVKHRFGLEMQFNGMINYNPARSIELFNERVRSKGWLDLWPQLQIGS